MSSNSFDRQVVIVTGAASGIGRVMAKMFSARGALVTVADVDAEKAERVVEQIRSEDGRAIATTTDVSREDDVEAMVDATRTSHGTVNILVNNAAICSADGMLATTRTAWDAEIAIVLTGQFLCTRAVLPGMIENRRGAIVKHSSGNGTHWAGNEAYSAAKAGVISLTKSVAARYGRFGVRANAVVPGSIRTEAWRGLLADTPDVFDTITKWFPLGRVGEPEDIAHAVLFLASAEASWITGTTLTVDGGYSAGSDFLSREFLGELRLEVHEGPQSQRDSALSVRD